MELPPDNKQRTAVGNGTANRAATDAKNASTKITEKVVANNARNARNLSHNAAIVADNGVANNAANVAHKSARTEKASVAENGTHGAANMTDKKVTNDSANIAAQNATTVMDAAIETSSVADMVTATDAVHDTALAEATCNEESLSDAIATNAKKLSKDNMPRSLICCMGLCSSTTGNSRWCFIDFIEEQH